MIHWRSSGYPIAMCDDSERELDESELSVAPSEITCPTCALLCAEFGALATAAAGGRVRQVTVQRGR